MCLAVYCVMMTIHYYIENYKEKGAFFICSSHEMGKFIKWQKMAWTSEVVITEDNKAADYELKVEAWNANGSKVEVTHKYPVQKFFDDKGYFHIRRAHDYLIDDILDKLQKGINKSV